jgi:hypothetical protein
MECTTRLAVPRATHQKGPAACKWSLGRTNEDSRAAPPRRPASACQPAKARSIGDAANRPWTSILAGQGQTTTKDGGCKSSHAGGNAPRRPGRIAADEAKLLGVVNGQPRVMSLQARSHPPRVHHCKRPTLELRCAPQVITRVLPTTAEAAHPHRSAIYPVIV